MNRKDMHGLQPPGARRRKLKKAARPHRWVVTYVEAHDPTPDEMVELKAELKGVMVIDEMPGSVLVEGADEAVRHAVDPLAKWTATPEGEFEQ